MDSPSSLFSRRHTDPVGVPFPSQRDLSLSPSIRSKHLLPDTNPPCPPSPRASTPPTPTSSLGSSNSSSSSSSSVNRTSDPSHSLSIRSLCPESPFARSRRSPPESDSPPMHVHSTTSEHTLDVWLPKELSPEMVTVSAKKGNKLSIVADVWDRENNSHYEWDIVFPPRDVDMNSIRVSLADGHVIIRAVRIHRQSQFY